MKKLSILGLVLIAASAVTAAVLPKNEAKEEGPNAVTDRLVANSTSPNGGQTCVESVNVAQCDITAASSETGGNTEGTSSSDNNPFTSSAANTTA